MLINELPSKNAIKCGALYLKPKNCKEQISKSVRLVVLEDKLVPEYPGRSGSCSLLKFAGSNYIICSRHQLDIAPDKSPDSRLLDTLRFASVVSEPQLTNIPVESCAFTTNNHDEEYSDLLIFRVPDSWKGKSQEEPNFYPITNFDSGERIVSYFVGCPNLDGVMEYNPPKINIKTAIYDCRLDREYISNSAHLKRFVYDDASKEVDGFSGGSVFSIIGDINNLSVVFDGIILRAGNGFVYVVGSDFLLTAIKSTDTHSHSIVPGGLLVTS